MKQQFSLKSSWSRIACRYAGKAALLLLIFVMATAARAQQAEDYAQRSLEPGTLSHLLHKQAYNDDVFDFGIEPVANDKITFVLNTKYLTEDTSTDSPSGISEVYTSRQSNIDDGWYTISGCRLNSKPTARGIYLHQGKKVVIK